MRILRLTIKDFRGFRSQDPILFDGHAVFVGENNVGKSTIIDALGLVLDPDPPLLSVSETDFPDAEFLKHRIQVEVLVGDLGEAEALFVDRWEAWDTAKRDLVPDGDEADVFDREGVMKVVRFGYRAWWDTEEGQLREQRYFSDESDWNDAQLSRATDRRRIAFFAIPFPRDTRALLNLTKRSSLSRLLTARKVKVEAEVRQVRQELRERGGPIIGANAELTAILDEIAADLGRFMRLQGDGALSLQPLIEHEADLMRTFQAVVHLEGDQTGLPLSSHGGGTRNIAAAIAMLCLAGSQKQFILSFEEPEVSLHPALQRHLIGRLRDRASQLIVSTHSADVASRFSLDEMRRVSLTGGARQVTSPKFPEGLTRLHAMHWSSKIAPALFSHTTVLVEGMLDEVAFVAIAAARYKRDPSSWDFDALNWTMVSFDGSSGTALAKAMLGFGLRVFAIVDGDGDGDRYRKEFEGMSIAGLQLPKTVHLEKLLTDELTESPLRRFADAAAELGDDELLRAFGENAGIARLRDTAERMLKQGKADRSQVALARALAAAYESDAPPTVVALLDQLRALTPASGFSQL
jgi:putative ATP-dependent endonuclease of the OLD family